MHNDIFSPEKLRILVLNINNLIYLLYIKCISKQQYKWQIHRLIFFIILLVVFLLKIEINVLVKVLMFSDWINYFRNIKSTDN